LPAQYASARIKQKEDSVAAQWGRRSQDQQPVSGVPSRSSGQMALGVLAIVACIGFVSWAKELLIPLSFAVLISVCLTPAVNFLRRARLPRAAAAALVLLCLSLLIGIVGHRTRGQMIQVVDEMPPAVRHLRHEVDTALNDPGSLAHRLKVLVELPHLGEPSSNHAAAVSALPVAALQATLAQDTWQFLSLTGEVATILFLAYLMLATGGHLQNRIAEVETIPESTRAGIRETFAQIQHSLLQYLGCLVLTNTLLGLSVWGAFWLLSVHYAAAWGLAAAVMHFVPFFGPTLIAGGSAVFASVQFDSLARGLLVGAITLALSSLIGVVLQTWLSGRSARMNTVAMLVSVLFWSWLWGLPGLVLGTPITIVFKVICSRVPRLAWFDALLGQRRRPAAGSQRVILSSVPRDGAPDSSIALPEVRPRRG
jgi:predicted PurR-regulated permease PerM